jgi:signal peptidase
MKKFAKILLDTLIYVTIVAGILWGVPKGLSAYLGTPYPMATVTSGSMWPVLHEQDLILIKHVDREDLKVGDVVVWRHERGFTIHRIVQLDQETFVTRGDANFEEDAPVPYRDLVGRMVTVNGRPFRIPYVGIITIAASKYRQQ